MKNKKRETVAVSLFLFFDIEQRVESVNDLI